MVLRLIKLFELALVEVFESKLKKSLLAGGTKQLCLPYVGFGVGFGVAMGVSSGDMIKSAREKGLFSFGG